MSLRIFKMLEYMNSRLSNIEKNIARIDEKLDFSIALQRNHLIRIKNGDFIDDTMILMGRPYNDLNPHKAFEVFSNPDADFIILDVTRSDYKNDERLEGAIHIPLEELDRRYAEVQSRTTPVMVISEQGLSSIQACEMLVKKGFFNINNISGGYEFWPGRKENQLKQTI